MRTTPRERKSGRFSCGVAVTVAMEMISQFNMQNPLPGLPTFNLGPSSRKDEDDEDPNPYGRMGF